MYTAGYTTPRRRRTSTLRPTTPGNANRDEGGKLSGRDRKHEERRGRTILSGKQDETDGEAKLLVRVRLSLGVKGGGCYDCFCRSFQLKVL